MRRRIEAVTATGRTKPVAAPSDRKRAAAEKAAAIAAATAAQQQEDTALRELDGAKVPPFDPHPNPHPNPDPEWIVNCIQP